MELEEEFFVIRADLEAGPELHDGAFALQSGRAVEPGRDGWVGRQRLAGRAWTTRSRGKHVGYDVFERVGVLLGRGRELFDLARKLVDHGLELDKLSFEVLLRRGGGWRGGAFRSERSGDEGRRRG